jgi:hypothetical protein
MRRAGISVLIVVGLVALAGGVASAGVSQFPTVFDKFKYKNDGNSKPEFSGKIDDDPPKSGKYYAEVEQKKFGQSGDKTTCKPTKSGKVEIS